MGYERKRLPILGGGFTCLPPADKIPITDYLLAQNFRADALGRLISRPGYPNVFTVTGGGIAHSAACAGAGPPYYVGCNSADTGTPSNVYYNGVMLASGFDGNRIGFAAANGYMWIMNRGKQGRHKAGGSFETWTLTPPPASPIVTAEDPLPPATAAAFTYPDGLPTGTLFWLTLAGQTYSFSSAYSYYAGAEIAHVLAIISAGDPNVSVYYPGTGNGITLAPIIPNTIMRVESIENDPVDICDGEASTLPKGTYQFYLTYQSTDGTLESNSSPASAAITVESQTIHIEIPSADTPSDSRVGFINIYASGGTLKGTYRIGQVPVGTTEFIWSASDATAIANGILMPVDNDLPPAAAGIIGPHFSRLYAWSTAANKNRLFWTPPNQPQYWPGAADPQDGNWVDVGLDEEEIVWCSIHDNLLVIYKERSIWMMIGSDPGTAQLEQKHDGCGLVNQFALAPAGQIDYFAGPNGLQLFDMAQVHNLSGDVLPLFNQEILNDGDLTPPGHVLPGTVAVPTDNSVYAIALGHALNRLFVSYAEASTGEDRVYKMFVFDEGPAPELQTLVRPTSGRWFYEKNEISGITGFCGFLFDGTNMIGLTGSEGGNAAGYGLADFRSFLTTDEDGGSSIRCVYGSHYDDVGFPENDKQWLEVGIDYEYESGTAADVYLGFNAGRIAPVVAGHLPASARKTVQIAPGSLPGGLDAAYLARSIAVIVDAETTGKLTIHNVYLYFYVEARVAIVASTIPTDLGNPKIKECKELELDIEAQTIPAAAVVVSDLPGHALTVRQTLTVAVAGRALLKYPFATTQGLLWQLSVAGKFRLYSARLLMRVLQVAVEGYETTAGFVWDSMEQALTAGEVSTVDQVRFEMDSDGATNVQVFTDLPGEAFASRGTYALTTGATNRAWTLVPMPDGIEARSVRLKVTGPGYRLYRAQVRHARTGRYLAGSTPSGTDDNFRALEVDFHGERYGMFKRLEIDLRAQGLVTVQVFTDQDDGPIAQMYTTTIAATTRKAVLLTFPPGIRGRLLRVRLTSPGAARIYHIRTWTRATTDPGAMWAWADFPLEPSDILAAWVDLIVEETSPVWQWVDLDMAVTESAA